MGRVMIERPVPAEARDADIRRYPVKAGESVQAGDVVDVVGGAVGQGFIPLPSKKSEFLNQVSSYITVEKLNDSYSVACCFGAGGGVVFAMLLDNTTEQPSLLSTATVYSGSASRISCARLSDTQFVVGYAMGAVLAFKVGVVNGQSISFPGGQSGITVTNDAGYNTLLPFSETQAFAVYNNGGLRAKVGTLSGYNIFSSGTEYALPGCTSASHISAARLPDLNGNKRVCVCYSDGGDGNKGKAVIATISSANVVTWGTPVVFYADNGAGISCCFDGEYVVAYSVDNAGNGRGGFVCAIAVSGNTLLPGVALNIPNSEGGGSSHTSMLPASGKVILLTGYSCFVLNRSGNTVALASRFKPVSGGDYVSSAKIEENKLIQCYADSGDSNRGMATLLEVRGDQIAGGFENASSQAIALTSGTSGQQIDVIFDGTAELPGITAGTSITSPGVQGYSPQDGWLWVKPEWDGKPFVTGSFTGDNVSNRVIDIGFKPTFVILTGGALSINYHGIGAVGPTADAVIAFYGSTFAGGYQVYSLTENGFMLRSNTANIAGQLYDYIAFR